MGSTLVLLGLAGRALLRVGKAWCLRVASEAFLVRAYLPDGSLVPRSEPGAVLHDSEMIVERAVLMVREGAVLASDGTEAGRVGFHKV